MSYQSPNIGQHSSEQDKSSSAITGSTQTHQLAGKSLSAPQGNQNITPARSSVTKSTPSSQSKIATSVAPRPLRGILKAYEPITPQSGLRQNLQREALQATKVSPGGSLYYLHPASIGLGMTAKWIRIPEPPRVFRHQPDLPQDFQNKILSKLADEHKLKLKKNIGRTKAHVPTASSQSFYSLSGGQNFSSETIKQSKATRVAAVDPRGRPPVTSPAKVTKASRRDAIYLAQVQALTKDSFKWLEETLEAEGISIDDEPESPESPLALLTPTLSLAPLLPSPIIYEGHNATNTDGGSGGLGLDIGAPKLIDPFASNSPSHPAESVYFSLHQFPDVTPKSTPHKGSSTSSQMVPDPSHKPNRGPLEKPTLPASVEPRGFYLQSLESAWDGDQLTRYPPFSGGSKRTHRLEKDKNRTTSPFVATSTINSSSYDHLEKSGSEPMLAPISPVRNNSAVKKQGDDSRVWFLKYSDHTGSGFINTPAGESQQLVPANDETSRLGCPQEDAITPSLQSVTSADGPNGKTELPFDKNSTVHNSIIDIYSPNRLSASPEASKKTGNFLRPTRPSIFINKTKFGLDRNPPSHFGLSLSSAKPDERLGFKSVTKTSITHLVNPISTGSRSMSRALFHRSLGKPKQHDHASTSTTSVKRMGTGEPPLPTEVSASGLSGFQPKLPIGAFKPKNVVAPYFSPLGRKSSNQVAPATTKRSIYGRAVFSKSLPHVAKTNRRSVPMPPMPKGTNISAESRARSTNVNGLAAETQGSP